MTIFMRGLLKQLQTRIYFADDPANAEDPVLALVPVERRPTDREKACRRRARVERGAARQERDGFLRLLSLELVFSDPHTAEALSDEHFLAAMARFEAALAGASPSLVPREHAETIARACTSEVRRAAPCHRGAEAGTLAIPFVRELTRQVPGEAALCPSRGDQSGRH